MIKNIDLLRKELFYLNHRVSTEENVFKTDENLNLSLKKNTAFIKKIRTSINSEQCENIINSIKSLSLEKYISEIPSALIEGLSKIQKNDDIVASMQIVSCLNQRFRNEIAPYLLVNFLVAINNTLKIIHNDSLDQEKEVQQRIMRQKILLQLFGEFTFIGLFGKLKPSEREENLTGILIKYEKDLEEFALLFVIKDVLDFEMKLGNSLSIALSFMKRFQHIIFSDATEFDYISMDLKVKLKKIFVEYTQKVFRYLVRLHKKIKELDDKKLSTSIKLGKIMDKFVTEIINLNFLFEKFKSNAEILGKLLNLNVPTLSNETLNDEYENSIEVVKSKSLNEDDLDGVWENVSEKIFFTQIPSLNKIMSDEQEITNNTDAKNGEKINDFLLKFANVNDENLNSFVYMFNKLNLNNKATKNKLFKFFIEISDPNIMKFYAKFIKINEANLKDLIDEITNYLDKKFISQINMINLNFKTIVFFIIMIKFKLIPTHIVFHKIRFLTLNILKLKNMDILLLIYDNVGRFLLNDQEYSASMLEMLDLLKEQQKKQNLSVNDKLAIFNIILKINNFKINKTVIKLKSDINTKQKFVLNILVVNLKQNIDTVILIFKKTTILNDKSVQDFLINFFSHPEDLVFADFSHLSIVLKFISKKNKFMLIRIIDNLLENITRGLELNDYKMNRIRINQVIFIAHLYNSFVVNFKFIIDLLMKIVCFGYINNSNINYNNELDSLDNYFRIRLCCSLLNTINDNNDKSHTEKKFLHLKNSKKTNQINQNLLSFFLSFFQSYILSKKSPIPIELQFKINQLYNNNSKKFDFKQLTTLKKFFEKLHEHLEKSLSQLDNCYGDLFVQDDYNSNDDDDDVNRDLENDVSENEINHNNYEKKNYEAAYNDDVNLIDYSESDQLRNSNHNKKFVEILENEYNKMIQDSYNNRSFNPTISSNCKLNVPLPTSFQKNENKIPDLCKLNGDEKKEKVSFYLLSKNGKKTDFKKLNLPINNKFSESILNEQANQKEYREKIINLVLNMND